MSRILAVCLVLALASVSYGDWLAQSWEDGGGDIGSWGPTIIGAQTDGVTDGSYSVAAVCAVGWHWIGEVQGFPDSYGNSVNSTAFDNYTTVSLDVHVDGADWSGDNGFQMIMAVNSGTTGWQQKDLGSWYWGGGVNGTGSDFSETISFNYQALKAAGASNWAQIILGENSYSNDGSISNAVFYFDNLRLTGLAIPEPATMALLGLGGLALIRRKK
jgi:PEP-CTERM motif